MGVVTYFLQLHCSYWKYNAFVELGRYVASILNTEWEGSLSGEMGKSPGVIFAAFQYRPIGPTPIVYIGIVAQLFEGVIFNPLNGFFEAAAQLPVCFLSTGVFP